MKVHFTVVGAMCLLLSGPGYAEENAPRKIPESIQGIMSKPRYARASWSLLVCDLKTGQSLYELNPDRMSFTGSTRKLFSVGMALNSLGPNRTFTSVVHRQGNVRRGVLKGDLILVAAGDLTLGGRRIDLETVEYTDFDHNDANGLGSAILTPQDPLFALDQLAADVKAAGVHSVSGEIVIDDRLFESYRVPNGNLLISPMMLNENQIDVTVTPTAAGQPARLQVRPLSAFFGVQSQVVTGAPGTLEQVEFSGERLTAGLGGTGTVKGRLPQGYSAPLTGIHSYVGTFRVEDPAAFARTAFIEALKRHQVAVNAPALAANPVAKLPVSLNYSHMTQVADFSSPPFSQQAKLILKVSLNLGANLSLSLLGQSRGQRTVEGSLALERKILSEEFGVKAEQFQFPSNGSGSPDSQAAPRALVQLLRAMAQTPVAVSFQAALPILGVDGSLAGVGRNLPGRGHVFAKPGTTVSPDSQGVLQLKAQNLAGYIETKSGRKVAYALMVNDAGPVRDIAVDVTEVFEDEGTISSILYESL